MKGGFPQVDVSTAVLVEADVVEIPAHLNDIIDKLTMVSTAIVSMSYCLPSSY